MRVVNFLFVALLLGAHACQEDLKRDPQRSKCFYRAGQPGSRCVWVPGRGSELLKALMLGSLLLPLLLQKGESCCPCRSETKMEVLK